MTLSDVREAFVRSETDSIEDKALDYALKRFYDRLRLNVSMNGCSKCVYYNIDFGMVLLDAISEFCVMAVDTENNDVSKIADTLYYKCNSELCNSELFNSELFNSDSYEKMLNCTDIPKDGVVAKFISNVIHDLNKRKYNVSKDAGKVTVSGWEN